MTEIRSRAVNVAVSAAELQAHLADLRNMEALLPQDKVKGFSGDEREVAFKIQGGLEIRLTRTADAFSTANFACKAEGLRLDFTSTFRCSPIW